MVSGVGVKKRYHKQADRTSIQDLFLFSYFLTHRYLL